MKFRQLLPILLGAIFLPACGGNVQFTIFPDGSGKAKVMRPKIKLGGEKSENMKANGASFKSQESSRISLNTNEYHFQDFSNMSLGDIEGSYKTNQDKVTIDLSIPIGPDANWFRELNVSQKSLNSMMQFKDNYLKTASEQLKMLTMGLGLDKPFVTLQINAPGRVLSKEVVKPKQNAPEWITDFSLTSMIGGGSGAKNKVYLKIPVKAIRSRKVKTFTVRIESKKGPTKVIKKQWNQMK